MTDNHLPNKLQWDPELVCRILAERVPKPAATTICGSVTGGYLPLSFRFIPDACFVYFTTGEYPSEAHQYRQIAESIHSNMTKLPIPPPPTHKALTGSYHYLSGVKAILAEDQKSAFQNFDKAATHSAIYKRSYLELAEGRIRFRQFDEALQMLDRYEELEKSLTMDSVRARAKIALLNEDYTTARAHIQKLISWNRDYLALGLLATLTLRQNNPRLASELYREAISLNPENADLHFNLAISLETYDRRQSQHHYQAALKLDPKLHDGYGRLARFFSTVGKHQQAAQTLEKGLDVFPNDVQMWLQLAQSAAANKDRSQATTAASRAMELSGFEPEVTLRAAPIQALVGDTTTTIASYQTAIKHHPNNIPLIRALTYQWIVLNKLQKAKEHLSTLENLPADDPRTLYVLGEYYIRSGQPEKAIRTLSRAKELDPSNAVIEALNRATDLQNPDS